MPRRTPSARPHLRTAHLPGPRPAGHHLAALGCVVLCAVALAPAVRLSAATSGVPGPAIAVVSVPAAEPPSHAAQAVSIESGETTSAVVVEWRGAPAALDGPAAVDLYDASGPAGSPEDIRPVRSVPVAADRDAVAVVGLDPSVVYQAVVTVTGSGGGVRRIGPSPAFRVGPDGPIVAGIAPGAGVRGRSSTTVGPGCLGAGYGVGAVSVDGWAGVQGSYCLPPAFSSGTGAFCVDHGLDYPAGAYRWTSAAVGDGVALVNQYGQAAAGADVARLAWVVDTNGATADPARSVAVGIIAHAVMGDYPGLSVSDLDPPSLAIDGGDPSAISADVASMWGASATAAGPYQLAIHLDPGPYLIGRSYRGTVTVTGGSGAPVADAAVGVSGSSGVSATVDAPGATGSAGTVGLTFTPTAGAFILAARTGPLPADTLALWTPQSPPVAVQRVVTGGPPTAAASSVRLAAGAPGRASLIKVSSDPAAPIGVGFGFAVSVEGAGGQWTVVAQRSTAAGGAMAPITGLQPGTYRVTETGHPVGWLGGGPWTFDLASGQQARWVLTDGPVPRPVRVVKVGDDPALPVGPGVTFALRSATPGSGAEPTPARTLTTGAGGVTPAIDLVPGTYRLAETTPPPGYSPAPPVTFAVQPVTTAGPTLQTVSVTDHAIPGTVRLVKTDAATGAGLAGARVEIQRVEPSGRRAEVGEWTTGVTPVDVSLPPGPYLVAEIRPPAGYQAGGPGERIELAAGQMLEVTFSDRRSPTPTTTTAPTPRTVPVTTPRTVPVTIGMVPAAVPATPSPPGQTLAFTGLPVWRWVLAAAAALAAGGILVGATRRRPAPR